MNCSFTNNVWPCPSTDSQYQEESSAKIDVLKMKMKISIFSNYVLIGNTTLSYTAEINKEIIDNLETFLGNLNHCKTE